jgi:hypothetical protein
MDITECGSFLRPYFTLLIIDVDLESCWIVAQAQDRFLGRMVYVLVFSHKFHAIPRRSCSHRSALLLLSIRPVCKSIPAASDKDARCVKSAAGNVTSQIGLAGRAHV